MPAKLTTVPFSVVINENTPYKFPLPKELAPSSGRFGGGGFKDNKVPAGSTVTRAVKITSASFTAATGAAASANADKLTSLKFTTILGATGESDTFSLVAFSNAGASSAAAASSSSSVVGFASSTIQLNLRIFIDASTQLAVSGPGTISLFGEELHEVFTPSSSTKKKKAKAGGGEKEAVVGEKRPRKFNKLPDGEEDGSDFDDGRSFGADDMYEQGIVYN